MVQISITREQLPFRYHEIVAQNPLLGRVEAQTRGLGWSDSEIRTLQLLLACASNASLTERVKLLETNLTVAEA